MNQQGLKFDHILQNYKLYTLKLIYRVFFILTDCDLCNSFKNPSLQHGWLCSAKTLMMTVIVELITENDGAGLFKLVPAEPSPHQRWEDQGDGC